ncbi:macro domain-containing protein [Deinococcus yavapaiensis]|uniref:O-acetyl-ADP-ribose deacetylase (Regulator of RNase III) n=1 Tax=Deinococcus yavapaiensis KR-236 TaxID=694435 RepID=A0A318S7P2_9DEIO|nr:macro domain-containing protein [Deinococcus yavapaiensis]PYE53926.1 O-acetyl-ADP-ribose deacetylase (regulator of RNase III) [Deinococcus yavapaiensis KR-236]
MPAFTLHLRDRDADVVDAWRTHFHRLPSVDVSHGDIFDVSADAIVSPANSFGFMDGGIDLAYTGHFGWDLQDRLRDELRRSHVGELPVGQALVLETFDAHLPYLVSAPTMRVPGNVAESVNAYLAFRAALLAVRAFNAANAERPITSVLSPGLCTAIGRMPPDRSARQMAAAYAVVMLGQENCPLTLRQAFEEHHRLLG